MPETVAEVGLKLRTSMNSKQLAQVYMTNIWIVERDLQISVLFVPLKLR